jgi:hypothetical protein
MHKNLLALSLAALLLAGGCGGPARVDGSSRAAAEQSVKAMADKMSKEEKHKFAKAVATVLFKENLGKVVNASLQKKHLDKDEIYKSLDGLTAEEIMAKADALNAKQ